MNNLPFDSPSLRKVRTYASPLFPFLSTCSAAASETIGAFLQIGVLRAIGMTLRTVGLESILIGTEKVLTPCNRFHVLGIDAGLDTAQVVNIQPVRNLTTGQFIGQPVHKNLPLGPERVTSNTQDSIAMSSNMACPQQTWTEVRACWGKNSWLGLFSKSLSKWLRTNHRFPILQMQRHFGTSRCIAWNIV